MKRQQRLASSVGEIFVDAFCGVGNFTLALAQQGAQVLGLESVASHVAMAQENARHNGI